MKSRIVSVILHVLDGLHKDVCLAYPELKGSFLKDKERIALCAQSRGLAYFTLDLPHLDSLLLRALECGRLSLEGPCSSRVSKRIQVPRLFSGLWLRVFEQDSCLKQDPDVTAVAFLRQFCCLGKKLLVECSPARTLSALENYHDIERGLRRPSSNWFDDELVNYRQHRLDLRDAVTTSSQVDLYSEAQKEAKESDQARREDRRLLNVVQQVADIVVGDLGYFHPAAYSSQLERDNRGIGFKHGPGAVAERLENWEKSRFPNWPHKLNHVFSFEDSALCAGDERDRPLNHELASRLICVPKSAKTPRLIAAEPVAHQWCQQLTWSWLQDALMDNYKGYFINFRKQELSADLVLKSSSDRKLATVDLSDASDRLSCWTVERMFRSNFSVLRALHAARTRYLKDNLSDKSGLFIKLNKFASQGTATTFPVQSIVFLIISLASAIGGGSITRERIWKCRHQVRVYGDDIIIPTHGYARLIRIMELLQLKVNVSKSYVNGHFRESCGADGFLGYDVTPVKPKVLVADGPASCQAVIDTSNNLFCKGYWYASDSLTSTLPPRVQRGLRIVGRNEAGYSGLASFSGSDESHLRRRWNSRLHRWEGRVWRLSPSSQNRDRGEFVTLLDFFTSRFNPGYPRIKSVYGRTRKTRSGLLWEPLNHGALGNIDVSPPSRWLRTRSGDINVRHHLPFCF